MSTPGARHPGDGWVQCRCGQRHWGVNGAAGLLVWRHGSGTPGARGVEVLLQLRAPWTHHGSAWGLPGGAVANGESPAQAALRECQEETGLPAHLLVLGGSQTQQHPDWSYTTFVAQAPSDRTWDHLTPADAESVALAWTPLEPRGNRATWRTPRPAQAWADTPVLPALTAVWDQLASLLPPPHV
ncbi:NUDIX domain-containing protein [Actinomyces wuliandei]|uniref:NUDIX domain-containing protein n=2 Tax=Actinomyces wuliandei TaxID=2057743 RepID=UPI000FD6DDB6|nr:NUDIX domain-containing protein [Actinomyces wuliandei]